MAFSNILTKILYNLIYLFSSSTYARRLAVAIAEYQVAEMVTVALQKALADAPQYHSVNS